MLVLVLVLVLVPALALALAPVGPLAAAPGDRLKRSTSRMPRPVEPAPQRAS
ncbi:hypothetical protein LL998_23905 [Burkholderia ambifaria]|uniref:hypothetical protein n=1 Tax=Burkholderia ambifaria TaxID=152480 RepID=UPI001E65AC2B|nr:hypothetical protein [Burkholderia ambifaria]UEP36695.1 hypothetical protein LL998_23905 [Burkholderia ambifaria]